MATVESQNAVTRVIPPPPQTANPPSPPPPPLPPLPQAGQAPPAQAIVPAQSSSIQVVTDKLGLSFTVKSFKPDGSVEAISIPLPDSPDFSAWSFAQQVGMLKGGIWKDSSLQEIIFGLAYAKHIHAEVLEGELFPTGGGRWGTSNKYKIKKGFSTGQILGYSVDTVELNKPLPESIAKDCIQKMELECTVTLEVKGFNRPITRKAKLSRWYSAANPNWKTRPEHMLELNTLAHAMEFLVPGETDEAPPATESSYQAPPTPTVADLKRERDREKVREQAGANALPDPTEIDNLLDSVQSLSQSEETQPVGFAGTERGPIGIMS